MRVRLGIVFGVLLLSAAAGLRGFEERPLPAFRLASAAGAQVASAGLSAEPRWVLMYVAAECRSCDRLVKALKDWQSPQLAGRTVIVVRGPVAEGAAYMAKQLPEEAAGIPWLADDQDEAWRALQLKGTPVLMGIERGQIKWTVSGVLNDPKSLESVVRTWVEY